jgi:hypothetical protein
MLKYNSSIAIYIENVKEPHYETICYNFANFNIIAQEITKKANISINIPFIYYNDSEKFNIISSKIAIIKIINEKFMQFYSYFFKYFYKISYTDIYVCIAENSTYNNDFLTAFKYHLTEDNILEYDNLINYCMIVKDAGEQITETIKLNLPYIDYWTILDTGSTDGTQDRIREALKTKPGALYEEPFINFRDSRNKCLELAGTSCKFNLMLDDTYRIVDETNIFKQFIPILRGDQVADSYSLKIISYDIKYITNRLLKSRKNLKYMYKIHEVVQDTNNINILLPENIIFIYDYTNEYMSNRTKERNEYDLKMLFEEVKDNPNEPRHLYYIAQTYRTMKNMEKAYEYYNKRINHQNEGFECEKLDAIFESAKIAYLELNYS